MNYVLCLQTSIKKKLGAFMCLVNIQNHGEKSQKSKASKASFEKPAFATSITYAQTYFPRGTEAFNETFKSQNDLMELNNLHTMPIARRRQLQLEGRHHVPRHNAVHSQLQRSLLLTFDSYPTALFLPLFVLPSLVCPLSFLH